MKIKKITALLISIIMIFAFSGCGDDPNSNKVSMPMSAKDMKGRNYEDVVTKLELAGYTNVYSEPLNDLIIGILNKDGTVDEVSANGKKDFRKDQRFDADTYIIVRYHSYIGSEDSLTEENSGKEPVLADTSDGMTGLPICSDDIKHMSVDKVVDMLTEAGFVNIKNDPMRDLVFGIMYSDGEISEVSIGGDTEYQKGDRYYPDVKIVIRYHSYS